MKIMRVVMLALILGATAVVTSCGSNEGSESSYSKSSLNNESELFGRRYTFLLRGDDGFPTLTNRYRLKIKPPNDGISRIDVVGDPDYPVNGKDSCNTIKLILEKSAKVMLVVADSVGGGMVTFEFDTLQPGEYTIGTGKHPAELAAWIKDCKRLVLSLVVDEAIRHRARWSVTPKGRLVHRLDF